MKKIKLSEREYHDSNNDSLGYCTECGATRECCEPDAENYPCDECEADAVFGTEQLLVMGLIDIVETTRNEKT